MCNALSQEIVYDHFPRQKQLTSRVYNRWSLVWDFARYTNHSIYKTALELLEHQHRKVVDVGCGSGLMSAKLAASGRRVVGVDISPVMIERARRRNEPGIAFVHGDAEKLPAADGEFDAVVNLISFHHYPDPLRAAAEFRRVLRPGGRLVLVAFDRSSLYIRSAQWMNRWLKPIAGMSWQKTSDEIKALLQEAGFSKIEARPVRYWIKTFALVAE